MKRATRPAAARGVLATLVLAAAAQSGAAPTEIKVWRHDTGDEEMAASKAAVERFNRSQHKWRVTVQSIPQGSYTESITAASLVGHLPCVIAMDQPTVPNFAWAGHVRPLDELLPRAAVARLLQGGRGTYMGKLYSVGQFDVVLVMYSRRSRLDALGVRVASMDQPYTAEEFHDILMKVKGSGKYRFPVDLNGNAKGEWVSYAFSPWLQSAGADLIDRANHLRVDGVLNGDAALGVARYYARLYKDKLAERIPADEKGFEQGRSLFLYTGSWKARDYTARFGGDLVVMPPPDFGHGPKVGAASWQWAVTRACPAPAGAAAFLEFMISPPEMAAMSRATGLVPVSEEAAALTEHYRPGGDWRIYFDFAARYATPRPATPAYPAISSAFAKAMADLRGGKEPAEAMDEAVEAIERNIARNHGYGFAPSKEVAKK
ncbi:extracellular solute-binding protein [Pseudoduganella namucuonensis]|uniref:Carbohydrate ABC transporter substrate-binding protein, CUT1 family n=1 Tax=Pseudoduganella namucuonensis TaxID=1035707 RepID=A0A1I7EUS9_9BURK|nr:extracellular solute-binding protein [Pseudoduganella namucuonensis]SFU27695.1 carbohydrate ABC transporter substrate-binding protein, CUT1 family [Pseudoduganella namucuonensis]